MSDHYDAPDNVAELLAGIRSGTWLDAQEYPPLRWAVPGVISEGYGLVVGPPKLGKSWFVLGVGLAIACGGQALGRIGVEPRPVLYAALEDGERRLQARCRHLMAGDPIPAAFDWFTEASDVLPRISAWLHVHPDGVVLLDTLGKVMPPAMAGESAYQRDYRVGGHLKALTDAHRGSTLLVVHHDRKMRGTGDWMDSTSGTQGLNGSADFTLLLERARGDAAALIRVTGRDVNEGDYAVTMARGIWTLRGATLADAAAAAREAAEAGRLGDDTLSVVRFVAEHPDGVSAAKVAAHMGWDDRKTGTYLGRLVDSGRISRPRRGTYAPTPPGGGVGSVDLWGSDTGQPNNSTVPTHFDGAGRAADPDDDPGAIR